MDGSASGTLNIRNEVAGRDETEALIRAVLSRVGDKWSVGVICQLGHQPRRFNELRRLTAPITQRVLSATLHGLQRDGLVTRTVHPTVPPQVQYALTEVGETLVEVVRELAAWTEENLDYIRAARAAYDGRAGSQD